MPRSPTPAELIDDLELDLKWGKYAEEIRDAGL